MYKSTVISDYIRNGEIVFRCCSLDEAKELIGIVSELFPDYAANLRCRLGAFGRLRFKNEIAFRFSTYGGGRRLDHGHCTTDFYRKKGFKVVDYNTLFCSSDFGAFRVNEVGMNDLLFGA